MEPNPIIELFNRALLFHQGFEAGELPSPYAAAVDFAAGGVSDSLGAYDAVVTFSLVFPVSVSGDEVDFARAEIVPVLPD